MLATTFVLGGIDALRNADAIGAKARSVTDRVVPAVRKVGVPVPQDPAALVRINAGVQLGAAFLLATGRAPRLSAAALAVSLVPTTVAGHPFWKASSAEDRSAQRLQFAKNLSMLGGLIIAAGDTNGRPGVAWRARRATKDARREARHLTGSVRREAKLAKAKLG